MDILPSTPVLARLKLKYYPSTTPPLSPFPPEHLLDFVEHTPVLEELWLEHCLPSRYVPGDRSVALSHLTTLVLHGDKNIITMLIKHLHLPALTKLRLHLGPAIRDERKDLDTIVDPFLPRRLRELEVAESGTRFGDIIYTAPGPNLERVSLCTRMNDPILPGQDPPPPPAVRRDYAARSSNRSPRDVSRLENPASRKLPYILRRLAFLYPPDQS
ncbi:hypothetical protein BV25DRAFT_1542714 [Artomyces pyxidatus]|uniref:Uncharacterized protein n=1 Tax=Artomyces pyxidatus TaxID=48021 RepID=A0ACB8SL09_9AGAM|nr:hypothetical protein BV25DRAFT_1542714 [Artomyces pyxidatus]